MATLERQNDLSSSHWYTLDKKPAYEIKKAKGDGTRPATLRDARKYNLLPSVTTIFAILAKPGLDRWKINKAIESAVSTPRDENEPDERYYKRILDRSFEETSAAAKLGTRIHDAIDAAFDSIDPPEDLKQYVEPTMEYLKTLNLENIQREDVVVNPKDGYAGRVDLLARFNKSNIVIDFKTKKTDPGVKITPFEFQATQIAAYGMAAFGDLSNCWGANIFISTTEPGRIETCVYKPKKLQEEYKAFLAMTQLWRFIKKYDPRS